MLFKPDRRRPIDKYINYFGDAGAPPDIGRRAA
jgi:hypothetical protein